MQVFTKASGGWGIHFKDASVSTHLGRPSRLSALLPTPWGLFVLETLVYVTIWVLFLLSFFLSLFLALNSHSYVFNSLVKSNPGKPKPPTNSVKADSQACDHAFSVCLYQRLLVCPLEVVLYTRGLVSDKLYLSSKFPNGYCQRASLP